MSQDKLSQDIEMTEKTDKPTVKRGLSQLSPRTRRIIRYLTIVLCVFGFFFQTTLLFIQYSKRQTVVNIKVEQNKYTSIPAITICYPAMVSMERTAQKYPPMKPLFDGYKDILKNMSKEDDKNNTFVYHLNKIYHKNFSMITHYQENISEIFDLTIPFYLPRLKNYNKNADPEIPIIAKVIGMRHFSNGSVQTQEFHDMTPIESVQLYLEDNKCFTFFSHLNETFREIKMDVRWIGLTVRII